MSNAGPLPPSTSLQGLFEAQVDRDPERVAVTCAGEHLTYRALEARGNQLAFRLRALGVLPGSLVAVCLERSLDLVVAILAVLKAGGAYVPLDPGHPPERLRFYLEDCRAPVLITNARLSSCAAPGTACVVVDTGAETIGACPRDRLRGVTSPEHLAYVIYTSGTTGRPKGVEITHANVARLFSATQPLFSFGPEDVWSFVHSAAFDFSVWELFGALLHGGRAVVVPRELAREPRELAALLSAERVTVLSQTPSAFRPLLPALLSRSEPCPLRSIVFAGEALEPAMLRPWVERFGDDTPALVNMYGITETTVHATYRRITTADIEAPRGSPIGRPLPDLEIQMLDALARPVKTGEIGEIYVVGAGVGRGYLGRPELTAKRFVTLPDGRRAYRSGDLARALPDGELVYLGREDEQVKIRGYRVELGEIQSRLLESPGISDAAALCRREGDSAEIIAYVVPQAGHRVFGPLLRAELARTLPDYMVPSAVLTLDRLPLSENGKLDRAALPPPRREQAAFRSPVTRAEQALCRCISRALGIEHVGAGDRFLDLGGCSLRAAQVARDLATETGLSIRVSALLSGFTVAQLAATLDKEPGGVERRPARVRTVSARASAVQSEIWLHSMRYPESAAYNETLTLALPGPIETELLEACLAHVVERHDALRTSFVWRSGALYQHVEPRVGVPLAIEDVRASPGEQRAPRAQRLAEALAAVPFDLSTPPLFRALLVRLTDRDHRLYFTVHHAICDAESLHNLAAEISALYVARASGLPPRLPELPVQYGDVVEGFDDAGHSAERAAPSPGNPKVLPLDFPAAAEPTSEGARVQVHIAPALARSLRAVGAAEGATLFMLLLAAWHALLYRYSGSHETRAGTVVAARVRPEHLPLIGPLLSVVPVTAHPRGDQPFTVLLAEARATLLSALEARTRGPRPTPVLGASFETVFGMVPPPPPLDGGFQARLLEVGNGSAKYDLALLLQEDGAGGVSGFLEYRTSLRHRHTVMRMAAHFVRLISSIAAAPDRPLAQLDMLEESEREQLLEWGHGRAIDPARTQQAACIHELFLEQAQRTPEAVAVESTAVVLTYRELAARAAAIAARLGALGIGTESLVAVCLERSPDLVAAWLGVLLAGGAFVPLDPAQPPARLGQVLADARPALLLTASALRGRMEGEVGAVLYLDEEHLSEAPAPVAARTAGRPGHLAYVLYTSGSTGRPKGVQIEHRGLRNLAHEWRQACQLRPGSRVLQFARVTFDAAIEEIFCTLSAGATVVLPDGAGPLVGAELLRVLRDRAITMVTLPPSVLAALPLGELPALRVLAVAGEACPAEVVDRWGPGRWFLNAYGPTEATVASTIAHCQPGQGKPPIGRPLGNIDVHVLDEGQNLVPIGVPGELYIGGAGLARGYLHEPALTAERFVEHPFHPGSGERLFRTGDRVRWLPDGRLDFLGRLDRQIKLRGFRIEPAEIEAALRGHPVVEDAVVVLREEVPGHPTLCAYVVMPDPAEADLRSFLRERVPDYMVPSAVVRLEALPLTPHGKIDLANLPSPRAPRAEPPAAELRGGSLPARIAAVWAEVLGVQHVGHGDSFFDLGGTSLLLVTVQERLQSMLGRSIPIAALFQRPTPSALSGFLNGEPGDDLAPGAGTRAERLRRAIDTRSQAARRRIDHG